MNWKIRSDDGKQAVLDIGDWGGLVLRGGYQAPPPPPAADAAAASRSRRRAAAARPRAPRLAVFDGFCWGIEPWDAKNVEAELRKRGLTPVADNDGKDFQSFHVKDPDGFDLQISNGSRKNRRQGAASGKTSAPAPFEATSWKTVWLDHISFEVSNYKETVAFYTALLGWKPGTDEGSQNQCEIGDIGDIIIRRGGGGNRGAAPAATPAAAPRGDRSHLVRHHAVRSRSGQGRARQARAHGARRHRRQGRHPHVDVQELSHDDAERIRSADQRDDAQQSNA